MFIILMVLVIIMASIIASPMTTGSEMVSTMTTTTSASIIALIIIIIASTGGSKFCSCLGIGLYNHFVVPFPYAWILYMVSYCCIDPYRVYGLCCYFYNSCYDNNCLHLHTALLAQGEGDVVETIVEVWI